MTDNKHDGRTSRAFPCAAAGRIRAGANRDTTPWGEPPDDLEPRQGRRPRVMPRHAWQQARPLCGDSGRGNACVVRTTVRCSNHRRQSYRHDRERWTCRPTTTRVSIARGHQTPCARQPQVHLARRKGTGKKIPSSSKCLIFITLPRRLLFRNMEKQSNAKASASSTGYPCAVCMSSDSRRRLSPSTREARLGTRCGVRMTKRELLAIRCRARSLKNAYFQ